MIKPLKLIGAYQPEGGKGNIRKEHRRRKRTGSKRESPWFLTKIKVGTHETKVTADMLVKTYRTTQPTE